MVEIKNDTGLCMTCNNAPSCFHRARRGPALYCETFDDFVPTDFQIGDRIGAAPSSPEPSPTTRAAMEAPVMFAGLCKNCDDRHTCGHPKPDGGVWHCEDYR